MCCLKMMSIYWKGNTDTPAGWTYVIIGVIIEFVTAKALSLTTDQGSQGNRIVQ